MADLSTGESEHAAYSVRQRPMAQSRWNGQAVGKGWLSVSNIVDGACQKKIGESRDDEKAVDIGYAVKHFQLPLNADEKRHEEVSHGPAYIRHEATNMA